MQKALLSVNRMRSDGKIAWHLVFGVLCILQLILLVSLLLKLQKNNSVLTSAPTVKEADSYPSESIQKPSKKRAYRSTIFPFTFVYDDSAYFDVKNNEYQLYGKKLGIEVPFQEIVLADEEQIILRIWDKSKKIGSQDAGYSGGQVMTKLEFVQQFTPQHLEKILTATHTSTVYIPTNDYVIEVYFSPGMHSENKIIKKFVESFRVIEPGKASNNNFMESFSKSIFSFTYPQDWSVSEENGDTLLFTLLPSEIEDLSKKVIQGFGYRGANHYRFVVYTQSLEEWEKSMMDEFPFPKGYIKSRKSWGKGTRIEFCNAEPEFSRGELIKVGDLCFTKLVFVSPKSKNILVEVKGDLTNTEDPIVNTVIESFKFL